MSKGSLSRRDLLITTGFSAAGLILHQPITKAEAVADTGPVVVLGANGFLGGDVVRSLLQKNIVTRAAARTKDFEIAKDTENLKLASIAYADVTRPDSLEMLLRGAGCVVFAEDYKTANPNKDPKEGLDLVGIDEIENYGLSNVAKACIQYNVPRLVVASSICAGCEGVEKLSPEDPMVKRCAKCTSKSFGENAVREVFAANRNKKLDYTIARAGELNLGEARGVKELEFNQGLDKNGIVSRLDFAEVLVNAGSDPAASGVTFECYYRDTAQPVDMFASLQKCQSMGKSTEQCFFGDKFSDGKPPSLDELLAGAQEGSIFTSGREVYGKENFGSMFAMLSKDRDEAMDLGSLGMGTS